MRTARLAPVVKWGCNWKEVRVWRRRWALLHGREMPRHLLIAVKRARPRDIDKVFPIVSNKGQAMPKRTSCNPGILDRNGLAYPLSLQTANLCPVQCGCVIPGQHHVFLDRTRQRMSSLCPPVSQLGPEVQLADRGECDAGSFVNQMFAVKICPRVALEGERPNVSIEYNSAHGRRLADSSAISGTAS